jgi:integrase
VSEAGFDHEQLAVFVWRADRAGGDTKTPRSRRTLALPRRCVEALREHRVRQAEDRLAAGPLWQDHGLVFASTVGTPLDDHNVRRQFRAITEAAGLGSDWVPRELRHTFVSLLSAHGVPVEAIALLAGHNQTATTELVYRHQIVPALHPRCRGHGPDLRLADRTVLSGLPRRRMNALGDCSRLRSNRRRYSRA